VRHIRQTLTWCCAGALLAGTSLRAQTGGSNARAALLVSPKWLSEHLSDPGLVILHVGDKAEYDAKHIPGARFVSLQDISVSDHTGKGLVLEMPTPDTLRAHLAALGISDHSRIVVYYGSDWVTPSTRVIFTLDYAGLGASASLLDGGMGAWTREGHEVTDAVPPARTGTLSALRIRPIVVDAEYVRAHIGRPGFAIVDGRAAAFYDGVQTGGRPPNQQRTGHIAGARSVPYTEITTDQLILRTPAELEALFTKVGVQPRDTVVGYCHVGQQATGMLYAARTLGHPVLLYDGSFEDWSRHTEYPVENPSQQKRP
jgi:thiosulfate/3-mercaptopyruvate sulfurtransferase